MPEPKYLVPYAGMIPIRFNGSRHLAISAPNEFIQIYPNSILGTPTSWRDCKHFNA